MDEGGWGGALIESEVLNRLACGLEDRPNADNGKAAAAVAAILTDELDPSLLFIHRVAHDKDPWSGHIAFPGGRIESGDTSARHAAVRETEEEVGLLLPEQAYIGQLDDITGATIQLSVSCHCFAINQMPKLETNHEVEDTFTVTLTDLGDKSRWVQQEFEIRGDKRLYSGIDLGLSGKPLLWGLTYRFVTQILAITDPSWQ